MRVNELKVGVVLTYVQLIVGNIVSIIYAPIMLRILGQNEYGLYNLSSSTISYLGLLSFGFGSAYIRYYSKYRVEKNDTKIKKLNGMFITVYAIIAIIALMAGAVLILNLNTIFKDGLTAAEISKSKVLMSFMVFNVAVSFPASVFNSYITANEKFLFQKILGTLQTILNPFIMLPVLLMGYKSVGMVIATTVVTLIYSGLNIWYCVNKLNMKFSFGNLILIL